MYGSNCNSEKKRPLTTRYTIVLQNLSKYLGATINSKLSFYVHIDAICKKANSIISFLHRNFSSCQCTIKSDLYLTYVKNINDCSTSVWAPHTNRAIESIQHHLLCQITTVPVVSLLCYCNGLALRYNVKKLVSVVC